LPLFVADSPKTFFIETDFYVSIWTARITFKLKRELILSPLN